MRKERRPVALVEDGMFLQRLHALSVGFDEVRATSRLANELLRGILGLNVCNLVQLCDLVKLFSSHLGLGS